MAQLLKRIVRSEIPNVMIPDLKIFLRRTGDSQDLIGPDVTGRPKRTLEEVCRSKDLDRMLKRTPPPITLWNEDGIQLTGIDMERATNLSTLADGGSGAGTDTFPELTDTPSDYSGTTPSRSVAVVNATGDGLTFIKLKDSAIELFEVTSFTVVESGGTYSGQAIFEKGYTVSDLSFAWAANETLTGKPSFSPITTLDGDPDASVGSGTLTGANLSDTGTYGYTITLTGAESGGSDNASSTLRWSYRAHWGFLSDATTDITTESQVESLPQDSLQSNTASSYSDTGASSQKYFWICIPNTWTQITTLTDLDTGFSFPFLEQSQVSVTGAHGTTIDYRIYRSYNSTGTTNLSLGVN